MAAISERAVLSLVGGTSANDLADALDLDSSEDARAAAMISVPVVMSNMARVAQYPAGAIGLLRMTRAQRLSGVTGIGRDGQGREISPADAVAAMLGPRAEFVTAAIGKQAGLNPTNMEWLLGETLVACLQSVALELDPRANHSVVAATFSNESLLLIGEGWENWIRRCLGVGNPSNVFDLARRISMRAQGPPTRPLPNPDHGPANEP